ncbi:MAG: T9SS type A sorting domain-containing protein [Bacteroidia bacterium]|nr:T9SS type A sorting domain-containing protein [Bacteroidia bacterium]MDW8157714.1 T9SS type A sorting domain-containing protein [Bacteroidia bacterium]
MRHYLTYTYTALLFALSSQLLFAQKIIQLTDNFYSERNPCVYSKYVVWAGFDGRDSEIFLYDLQEKKLRILTQNTYNDVTPQVNETHVSWISLTEKGTQIYLYHINSGQTQVIPFNGTQSCDLAMSERYLVWMDSSQKSTLLYLFDIEKKHLSSIPIPSKGFHHKPKVNNDFVVWQTLEDDVYYIHLYKINEGQLKVFSRRPGFNPALDKEWLIWQTDNFNLYLYNLKQKNFFPCPLQGENPKVSHDKIVAHGGKYNSYDVFIYNIKTKQLEQIANTGPSFYDLTFHFPYLAWRSFDGNDYEIFLIELGDSIKALPKLISQGVYSIYPNPVVDELYIRYKQVDQKPDFVQIMELDGTPLHRFIKFASEEEKAVSLKLGNLPRGIYLLEIKKGEVLERTRIILY